MHTLIATAHPDSASFTHAVARRIAAGIATTPGHTSETADLAAEGFDPRYTVGDVGAHLRRDPADAGVLAEQRRIDRADALVLVYPVYWWSMPALMKGWIDRVFANGWAYDEEPGGDTVRRLGRLAVQLVALGGADLQTYARHGYLEAMRTGIDHGIFGYCGAPVVGSALLHSLDAPSREEALGKAFDIGQGLRPAPRS